jgi:hypothetical protein
VHAATSLQDTAVCSHAVHPCCRPADQPCHRSQASRPALSQVASQQTCLGGRPCSHGAASQQISLASRPASSQRTRRVDGGALRVGRFVLQEVPTAAPATAERAAGLRLSNSRASSMLQQDSGSGPRLVEAGQVLYFSSYRTEQRSAGQCHLCALQGIGWKGKGGHQCKLFAWTSRSTNGTTMECQCRPDWLPKRALGCACTADTKALDTKTLSDHHQSTFWCGSWHQDALVSHPLGVGYQAVSACGPHARGLARLRQQQDTFICVHYPFNELARAQPAPTTLCVSLLLTAKSRAAAPSGDTGGSTTCRLHL